MSTKKRKRHRKHSRKLAAKMYLILSGKSHRVVGRSTKLGAARRKARGLVKRGSKHVSIRRGSKSFAVGGARRRTSRGKRRRTSKGRRHHRRTSRGHRRHKRSSRGKRRRTSKKRRSR